ncbi:hypothetical protein ACIRVK_08660 [Streptomyces sp. NPDC101152]|uniref:hypothetical protein n=1 Tax=Streptomyces sp. NPDC101152 TaxID=3366116 RepID=UPI00382C41F2
MTEACRILRDRQIDAWPGWERLADYPQRKREEFTARAPHLVSGVLLNSGGDVSEARDILAALTPQPTAYVAVGTSEALESLQAGQPNGVAFTLPFHPALYDHAAAETEHRAVEERCSRRIQRLAEVVASKRRDEALRHRIATWRESYPPGPSQPCPKQLLWPPDSTTSPNDWPRSRDGRTWPVPPKYDEISRTKRLTKPCDADMDGLKGLIHSAFRLNVQGNSPSGNSLGGLCRPPLGALFWV